MPVTTIDIAIPYWGDPGLMIGAVDSVLAQTDPRWRLIVIDDCYPDDTVRRYVEAIQDERVTYLRNEVNIGISANFRKSVQVAESEFVTIMGCDDELLPEYVAVVLAAAEAAPQAAIVQPGVVVVDSAGVESLPLVDRVKGWLMPRGQGRHLLTGEDLAASLLRGNWLYWPSLAFRTEVIRSFDFRDDLAVIQDLAILVDIAFAGGSLVYDPHPAFRYRRHESSASQVALLDGSRFRDERRYYAGAREDAAARGWKRARAAASRRWMSRLHALAELPGALVHGRFSAVAACLAHALR